MQTQAVFLIGCVFVLHSDEPDLPGARCVQGPGWDVGRDETQSLELHGEQRADGPGPGKQAPPSLPASPLPSLLHRS